MEKKERKKQGAGPQRRQLMRVWRKKNRTENGRKKKEKQGADPQPNLTWTIRSSLTTRMDHTSETIHPNAGN